MAKFVIDCFVLYKSAIHIKMDISSRVTLRKNKTGQVPEGHDAMQLSDVFNLLLSMEKRLSEHLSAIESTLMDRLLLAESSLERAHNTISYLKSDLSGIKTELAEVRAEKRKSDTISELRSKEFNLLFHGLPTVSSDETPEQSEDVVRSFLTTSLQFPESDLAKISFANVHRLPKHTSALQSSSTSYSQPPEIVVKFSKMKDRI